ncbi:DUF3833 domain-containing protein [Marinibactrum halimedae]|uniref:DUF3833 domain-containing protein n=1 Tax=Marinibactrum halimedae TaxID=1444977 RepID=A0AA37T523_9GAMM|nr:DUF3833 domain-containing protein [Marinibactrum halimedae]MCD9459249.1 DUF3833 domain-containing protein [Marinibactrum halimedae]GLS27323.1 hypothetical protein GCM10007877_30420 [Marinibactrum halimedae]
MNQFLMLSKWSKPFRAMVVFLFTTLSLLGCSTTIDEYKSQSPTFLPETFFNGPMTAHGMVKDYRGKVIRTFYADINAYWVDDTGVLDESFIFNDGEKQIRRWEIQKKGNTYTATASDVIGSSALIVAGNALTMTYELELEPDGMTVSMEDWIFLIDEHTALAETQIRKWGLPVGEITLTMRKLLPYSESR